MSKKSYLVGLHGVFLGPQFRLYRGALFSDPIRVLSQLLANAVQRLNSKKFRVPPKVTCDTERTFSVRKCGSFGINATSNAASTHCKLEEKLLNAQEERKATAPNACRYGHRPFAAIGWNAIPFALKWFAAAAYKHTDLPRYKRPVLNDIFSGSSAAPPLHKPQKQPANQLQTPPQTPFLLW